MNASPPSPENELALGSPKPAGSVSNRDKGESRQSKLSRKIFLRFFISLLCILTILGMAVFWVIPRLGEQGNLNSLVEDLLRESLNIPVRIDRIETDPLSRLAITHMTSLKTEEDQRLSFSCDRLSILYSPWDLVSGQIEELTLVRPRLKLNLDSQLSEVFSLPTSETTKGQDELQPFIGHLVLENGSLDLKYAGEEFLIRDLQLEVWGLGGDDQQAFDLKATVLGSPFEASGEIWPVLNQNGQKSYKISSVKLKVEQLKVDPIMGLLRVVWPGLDVDGAVDLEGQMSGVWPDALKVHLSTQLNKASYKGEETKVESGNLNLFLDAELLDEVSTINFDIQLEGQGQVITTVSPLKPRLQAKIKGVFQQNVRGGLLSLEQGSGIEFQGFGRLGIEGEVASLFEEPELFLNANAKDWNLSTFPLSEFEKLIPGDLSPGWLAELEGKASVALKCRGTPDLPELSINGEFNIDKSSEAFKWPGSISFEVGKLSGFLKAGSTSMENMTFWVRNLELDQAIPGLETPDHRSAKSGKVDFIAKVGYWRTSELPKDVELEFTVRELSFALFEDFLLTEDAKFSGSIKSLINTPAPQEGEKRFQLEYSLKFEAPFLAIGTIGLELDDDAIHLAGKADWQQFPLKIPELFSKSRVNFLADLDWPEFGRTEFTGILDIHHKEDHLMVEHAKLSSTSKGVRTQEVFNTYIRDPLQEDYPALQEAVLTGKSILDWRYEYRESQGRLELDWSADEVTFQMPRVGLETKASQLVLPMAWGSLEREASDPQLGFLKFDFIKWQDLQLRSRRIDIEMGRDAYRFSPLDLEELGGKVKIDALKWSSQGEDQGFTGSVLVEELNLQTWLSQKLGVDVSGTLEGKARRFRFFDDRLEVQGNWSLDAFGGRVDLGDFSVEYLSQPYFVLQFSDVHFTEIHLLELGKVFDLGVLSGVLQGEIRDLQMTSDDLLSFEADLETIERSGVGQYIDLKTIESFQRMLSGRFFGLESFLFSRFDYSQFGFWAKLSEGSFRVRGKYKYDDVEYLMYSPWYYFPGVRIANSLPGKSYSWDRIVKNIKSLFGSN